MRPGDDLRAVPFADRAGRVLGGWARWRVGSFPEGQVPISRGSGGNDMITSACAECAGAVVEREEIGS